LIEQKKKEKELKERENVKKTMEEIAKEHDEKV